MFSTAIVSFLLAIFIVSKGANVWESVPCHEEYFPENCNFTQLLKITVEDYERCAPALLPVSVRNFFLGAAGRRITYNENQKAYQRIRIIPKVLRDVSRNSLETTVLGQRISFPIGISPTAYQKLTHPMGEIATAIAASDLKTVMILSSLSSVALEEVAEVSSTHLWMQVYIYRNRTLTEDLVRRAERFGFKAIVLTADSPFAGPLSCTARGGIVNMTSEGNFAPQRGPPPLDAGTTFNDITWLKTITKLPIVVKGVLSGQDAVQAVKAGASAILVSNHGGRQLDGDPATIDVLPGIVDAVKMMFPQKPEIFIDGGIRSGFDVYKALARGAKAVFIGRPVIWGLTVGGVEGVKDVMTILKKEFNHTMILAGSANPSEIRKDSVIPSTPVPEFIPYNPLLHTNNVKSIF